VAKGYDAEKDVLVEKIGTIKLGDDKRLVIGVYSYDGGELRIGTSAQFRTKKGDIFSRAAGRLTASDEVAGAWCRKVLKWLAQRDGSMPTVEASKKAKVKDKPKKAKKSKTKKSGDGW